MKTIFIKQAVYIPAIYFGMLIISGLFANDYSHLGQHASELGINSSKAAVILFQVGIILTSVSLFGLSAGLFIKYKQRFVLTSTLVLLFGITFIFGAIFPIGSPWHGFYGLGLFIFATPFVFLYEQKGMEADKWVKIVSVLTSLFMFLYLWSMVARLDPINYRGLTQRIFGLVVFGWISFIAYYLSKSKDRII